MNVAEMSMVSTKGLVTYTWDQLKHPVSGAHGRETEAMFQKIISLLRRRTSRLGGGSSSNDMGESGSACNEALFKYLLASERIRSERSGCSIQLLLVMLLPPDGGTLVQIDGTVARSLFSVLKQSLRGTDYTGWYQDQYIIGAVLTAMGGCEVEEISKQVEQRFREASRTRLSGNEWGNLRVRICQQSEMEAGQIAL